MIIRKAGAKDLAAIVDLWKELMDFHAARDSHYRRRRGGEREFAKFVRKKMDGDSSRVWVASGYEGVVGYCLSCIESYPPVFRQKRFGMVYDLCVTARWRRKGVGSALFTCARRWFRSRGMRRIELRVATSNPVSNRFWGKMGFAPCVQTLALRV